MTEQLATRLISKSSSKTVLLHENGKVPDIIAAILKADAKAAPFTAEFAPHLKGKTRYATLRNIWRFTKDHIRYKEDEPGDERIKSPGATWKDRYGDCKSFSVFIGSLLKNLGIPYFYRVVFYDKRNPSQGHIYPVARLQDGTLVIMDAVHSRFDDELPYWKAQDYDPSTGQLLQESLGAIRWDAVMEAALGGIIASVTTVILVDKLMKNL